MVKLGTSSWQDFTSHMNHYYISTRSHIDTQWLSCIYGFMLCKNQQPEVELIQPNVSHNFSISKHAAWLS